MTESSITPAVPPAARGAGRPGPPRAQPYLLIALAAGIALHGLALGLVRPQPASDPRARAPRAFVSLANPEDVRAQAELYDPVPLVLPSPRNFASREQTPLFVQPPTVFGPFAVSVAPDESAFGLAAQDADLARPLLALAAGRWDILREVGQGAAPAPPAPRGAQVYALRLGGALTADAPDAPLDPVVVSEVWPPEALAGLPASAAGTLWQPAVFVLLFGRAGPVGVPVLKRGTRVEALDLRLRALVEERYRRQPLPPGTYEITIGP